VLSETSSTLSELKRTSQSLTELTGKNSRLITNLNNTLQTFQEVGTNFKTLTQKNGSIETTLEGIRQTLRNVDQVTDQLTRDNHLTSALANLDTSSQRLKQVLSQLQHSLDTALPNLNEMLANLSEVSGRIRTQPWRLIWPSTIHYNETAKSEDVHPPRKPRGASTEVASQLGRKGVGAP
jgi:ABC-type transporter Mla subunit MlaD